MHVHVVPFGHIRAAADVSTSEIFISLHSLLLGRHDEDLAHEVAHVVTGDVDHTAKFSEFVESMGYEPPRAPDIFSSMRRRLPINASTCANVGNVTGIQNVLTDLHLLAAYRKFSKKILGTEGHWEVIGEVDGDSSKQLIRLYPTPKGAYPVTVLYYPSVSYFRSPQAKQLANDMLLAESKCILGRSLRKITGLPSPDGGSVQYDGDTLATEGQKEKDELVLKALQLGEPDRIFVL